MEDTLHGIIIRVYNLDVCREFYSDVLNLGSPILDSNFWVEFKLPNGVSLCLEKMEEEAAKKNAKSLISWIFNVEDTKEVKARLSQYGYEPTSDRKSRLGLDLTVFHDPEGNPFYLRGSAE